MASVDNAIKRVRLLINHVQRTPELRIKIQDRLKSQNLELLPSSLPRLASWFQVRVVSFRTRSILTDSPSSLGQFQLTVIDFEEAKDLPWLLRALTAILEDSSGDLTMFIDLLSFENRKDSFWFSMTTSRLLWRIKGILLDRLGFRDFEEGNHPVLLTLELVAQVFNVLQALQAGRDCIHAVLTESREDTNALLPSAKDSNALEALQASFSMAHFSQRHL